MIEKENRCISRPDNVSDYQLESTTQVFEKKMAFEKKIVDEREAHLASSYDDRTF